ncbi:hypothetical protein [Thalassotalea atypica]|uniref:hypothetical protein n=1 Tax=Thalassotalea atypica TaxID=2054316 RepID=UPI0025744D1B|nr:hypothetical protein [Thalassotalea atypica]
MAKRSSRLKGILVVFASTLLAITVCSVFYYFKIEQNESYQNQLHFRELQNINTSFNNGIGQFKQYSKQIKGAYKQIQALTDKNNDIIREYHPDKAALEEQLSQQNQSLVALLKDISSEDNANEELSKTIEAKHATLKIEKREFEELSVDLDQAEFSLLDEKETFFDVLEEITAALWDESTDYAKRYDNECEQSPERCQWLEQFIDNIIDIFDSELDLTQEDISNLSPNSLAELIIKQANKQSEKRITKLSTDLATSAGKEIAQIKAAISEQDAIVAQVDSAKPWFNKFTGQQITTLQSTLRVADSSALPQYLFQNEQHIKDISTLIQQYISSKNRQNTRARNTRQNQQVQILKLPQQPPLTLPSEILINTVDQELSAKIDNYLLSHRDKAVEQRRYLIGKLNLIENVNKLMLEQKSRVQLALANMYVLNVEKQQVEEKLLVKKRAIPILEREIKTSQERLVQKDSSKKTQLKNVRLRIVEIRSKLKKLSNKARIALNEKSEELLTLVQTYYSDLLLNEPHQLSNSSRLRSLKESNTNENSWQRDFEIYTSCLDNALLTESLCEITFTETLNLSSPINTLLLAGTALKNLKIKSYKSTPMLVEAFENEIDENPKVILDGDAQTIVMSLPDQQVGEAHHIDFMGEASTRYPLVLLVNETGEVIVSKENQQINASLKGIEFEQLNHIFLNLFEQQKPQSGTGQKSVSASNQSDNELSLKASEQPVAESKLSLPGYSGYIDVDIAGDVYRLFISPYTNKSKSKTSDNFYVKSGGVEGNILKSNQLYLIGFRDKSNLVQAKLSLSRSLIIIAIFTFFGLFSLIPLFKIRLVSQGQAFSNFDRHYTAIGLLLLVTVVTVGGVCGWQYADTKQMITKQSKAIFTQIRNRFNNEITLLAQYAEEQFISKKTELEAKNSGVNQFSDSLFTTASNREFSDNQYFLDNLFYLTAKDDIKESTKLDGLAMWSTTKTYRSNDNVSVYSRDYAKNALQNEIWPISLAHDSQTSNFSGLYIERVFNLRDSRLTTQFSRVNARQLIDNPDRPLFDVLSYGTKLQTFFNAVLPENFGFVVFETHTGQALYHSDDKSRSLVENVYVETDNNPLFKSLKINPYTYEQPVNFDAIYGGKMHHFSVGAIHPDIPWKLAIFYDKEERRSVNLIAAIIALFLSFVVSLLVYASALFFMRKRTRRYFFWPEYTENVEHSRRKLISNTAFAAIMTIAVGLVMSFGIFALHEQRYIEVLDARLADAVEKARVAHNKYRQLAIEPFDKGGNPIFLRDIQYSIPCYMGGQATPDAGVNFEQCTLTPLNHDSAMYAQSPRRRGLGFSALVEYFWSFSMLTSTIDESLTISQKLADVSWYCHQYDSDNAQLCAVAEHNGKAPSKYIIDKTSVPNAHQIHDFYFYNVALVFVMAILILIAFYLVRVLIVDWLFQRLIGIDIPIHFRQQVTKSNDLLQHIDVQLFKTDQFALVIRPDVKFKKTLFEQLDKQGTVKPLINKIINVATWYKQPIIKTLESEINEPNGIKLVLNVGDNHQEVKALIDDDRVSNIIQSLFDEAGEQEITEQKTLFIEGFETIANDKEKRLLILDVLEALISVPKLNVVIFCEVAPLYMLTKQSEYPCAEHDEVNAQSSEVKRWSNLFRKFKKIYQWSASRKPYFGRIETLTADETLINEARGWPELKGVLHEFCQYHNYAKTQDEEDNLDYELTLELLTQEQHDRVAKNSGLSKYWQPSQIVEFFSGHAGALYRYRWELCTKAERLLLFQLANDFEPNPKNLAPIEHLTRRGYIYRDCGWHIINESFKQFILTAEPPEVMEEWLDEANDNIWRYLRIPFFALLIALLAIMAYAATDAIESALGVLTAILGLIPMAIRNFALFKGGS